MRDLGLNPSAVGEVARWKHWPKFRYVLWYFRCSVAMNCQNECRSQEHSAGRRPVELRSASWAEFIAVSQPPTANRASPWLRRLHARARASRIDGQRPDQSYYQSEIGRAHV